MRRRRSNGTWFPVFGTAQSGFEGQAIDIWGHSGTLLAVTGTRVVTEIIPVTTDEPLNEQPLTSGTDTLVNLIGNEYFLRRLVGKVFCTYSTTGSIGEGGPQNVIVAAGFFVARAQSQLTNVPVGVPATQAQSNTNQETGFAFNNYSPLANAAQREPWIWRRTWVLGDRQVDEGVPEQNPRGNFPFNNASYGSVMDGPHLDAKTRRRVTSDDRLWFAIAATQWPLVGGETATTGAVAYGLDLRIFGSLRKARNRGVF